MKDVFKYIKSSRELLEGKAAEEAKKKGYVGDKSGYWIDRKGERVARTIGGELKMLTPREKAEAQGEAGGGGSKGEEGSQGPEFKSEIPRTPAMANAIENDPELAATQMAITKSQGMWPHYTDERKQYHVQKELEAIEAEKEAQIQAKLDAEAAAKEDEVDDLIADVQGKEVEKDADDFKTVDEVIDEREEETTEETEDDDFDAQMAEFEKDYQETLKGLTDRQKKALDKRYGAFREAMAKIPPSSNRNSFMQAMAHAKTFEGRVNAGAGKNNLGFGDVQNLMANRERLMEGYGDGSPQQIKKFVDSVRSNEVSDEFVDASFEILPDAFKKSLSGKGQVTNDKYVSDDKAHKDMHYLGRNEDGTARRGAANNKDRAKLMWRIYLEQGGRDAYTGLPLDIQAMDLEHVRGFNNKDDGKPSKEQWEQRENDDNFTLINSNINQKKVDLSMKDFFEREVDPLKDKGEDEFGGIEKLFEKQNQIGSVGDQLAKTLLGEGGKGMGDSVTREILTEHFSGDDQRHTELRDEFRKFATDDKTKKKAAGIKSKLGKTLLKSMGLTRGITDPSGRRTVALQENVYRGFLQSMANAKPKDRQKYTDGWAEAIKAGNDERSPKAVNRKLVELGLIDEDILNDRKAGRVFKEEYDRIHGSDKGRNFIRKFHKDNFYF